MLPIEAQLHIKALGLFGNICRLHPQHTIKKLAWRQLAVRVGDKHSWFHPIVQLGCQYHIDIMLNLRFPAEKGAWKTLVKSTVLKF